MPLQFARPTSLVPTATFASLDMPGPAAQSAMLTSTTTEACLQARTASCAQQGPRPVDKGPFQWTTAHVSLLPFNWQLPGLEVPCLAWTPLTHQHQPPPPQSKPHHTWAPACSMLFNSTAESEHCVQGSSQGLRAICRIAGCRPCFSVQQLMPCQRFKHGDRVTEK